MSTIPFSQVDAVPRQKYYDQLFEAGNIITSVVDIDNIKILIKQCFDLINHGV